MGAAGADLPTEATNPGAATAALVEDAMPLVKITADLPEDAIDLPKFTTDLGKFVTPGTQIPARSSNNIAKHEQLMTTRLLKTQNQPPGTIRSGSCAFSWPFIQEKEP